MTGLSYGQIPNSGAAGGDHENPRRRSYVATAAEPMLRRRPLIPADIAPTSDIIIKLNLPELILKTPITSKKQSPLPSPELFCSGITHQTSGISRYVPTSHTTVIRAIELSSGPESSWCSTSTRPSSAPTATARSSIISTPPTAAAATITHLLAPTALPSSPAHHASSCPEPLSHRALLSSSTTPPLISDCKNVLVNVYCNCREYVDVDHMFDTMPVRDVVSIAAYHGRSQINFYILCQ